MDNNNLSYHNKTTKWITMILGITLAISSLHHGFFELLQGNTNTKGILIQAIGENQRYWSHGTEEALTIIPNFLITGLLAIAIGVFIIIWTIGYIDSKHGRTILLLSFIASVLFGGGIAQIIFFLPIWGYSTRLHKKLKVLSKLFSNRIGRFIGKLWPVLAVVAAFLFIIALEMSIFGFVPGVADADTKLYTIWIMLGVSLVMIQFAYLSGFAYDISKRVKSVD